MSIRRKFLRILYGFLVPLVFFPNPLNIILITYKLRVSLIYLACKHLITFKVAYFCK